ncbi:MAG TPA: hypothetical protein VJP45_01350 [Candidatus Limnocylindria bacterium]|nr:hypothetical protein [Candidatus Limnocylindria bacterium]
MTATRKWVTTAVVGIAAFPAAIVVHNVLSAIVGGEEVVSFVIALLVAPGVMAVGTLGAARALTRHARFAPVGRSLVVAGSGLAVFALYALLVPVIRLGADSDIPAALDAIVLPLSGAALAIGAALAALARLRLRATISSSG